MREGFNEGSTAAKLLEQPHLEVLEGGKKDTILIESETGQYSFEPGNKVLYTTVKGEEKEYIIKSASKDGGVILQTEENYLAEQQNKEEGKKFNQFAISQKAFKEGRIQKINAPDDMLAGASEAPIKNPFEIGDMHKDQSTDQPVESTESPISKTDTRYNRYKSRFERHGEAGDAILDGVKSRHQTTPKELEKARQKIRQSDDVSQDIATKINMDINQVKFLQSYFGEHFPKLAKAVQEGDSNTIYAQLQVAERNLEDLNIIPKWRFFKRRQMGKSKEYQTLQRAKEVLQELYEMAQGSHGRKSPHIEHGPTPPISGPATRI